MHLDSPRYAHGTRDLPWDGPSRMAVHARTEHRVLLLARPVLCLLHFQPVRLQNGAAAIIPADLWCQQEIPNRMLHYARVDLGLPHAGNTDGVFGMLAPREEMVPRDRRPLYVRCTCQDLLRSRSCRQRPGHPHVALGDHMATQVLNTAAEDWAQLYTVQRVHVSIATQSPLQTSR